MKILAIHNFHRKGSASGDDQVFKNETSLLQKHGHIVIEYTVQNDEFDVAGVVGKLKSGIGMFWSFKHFKNVKKLIKKEKPDVVHVHTFFPLLSPSILYAAKRCGVKVVATLHDTRFVCPCATSLRNMKLCNECGDGYYFRMVKYGCFKNSRIQSLIVAFIFKFHRIIKSFYNQIDKYICLNDNQIQLLENIGFERKKIIKKYNFVNDVDLKEIDKVDLTQYNLPQRYVVFYGRIGEEKGIHELMHVWQKIDDIPLVAMGAGPLENEFSEWAQKKKNVLFLGYVEHLSCMAIVKSCEFVVFPSIWYEGCSMVEIETESLSKPIIATDLGFSSEAIQNEYNGLKFELNNMNDFEEKIKFLWNSGCCKKYGQNARKDFDEKYTSDTNIGQLVDIYKSL